MATTATPEARILKPRFAPPKRAPWKRVGAGVYQDPRTDAFYERATIDGRRTWRKLDATTIRKAELEVAKKRSDHALSKRGLADNPYAARATAATVAELAKFYLDSGCPKRNEQKREGKQLEYEKVRVQNLVEYFGRIQWNNLDADSCRDYHRWRTKHVGREHNTGDRSADMDLGVLSSMLRWAQRNPRRTGVDRNPLAHERPQFHASINVRHCRDFMPANGDELHNLARFLLQTRASETLGWQMLFEAFIGHRTAAILKLRMDAKTTDDPGFVQGKHLFLYRSATHKGTYPFADITAPLRQLLDAHSTWHTARYPDSPWFFPGLRDESSTVDPTALTKALARVTRSMGLPHRTSHGLRAYHANVLRSMGKPDAEIALRMGHKSGKLLVSTYGEILPIRLTFMPEEVAPAWAELICKITGAPLPPTQLELL